MNLQQSTSEQIQAAIDQKTVKWGGLKTMPPALAELVQKGITELDRRKNAFESGGIC